MALFLRKFSNLAAYFDTILTEHSFLGLALIFIIIQMVCLTRINKKRDEAYGSPEGYTSDMKRAESDRGNDASFFRYTI